LNFSFAEGDELAGATGGNNDSFGKLEQPNTDYYHTSVVSQVKIKPTVVTNYQTKRELEVMQKYGIKKIVPVAGRSSNKGSSMR